MLVRRLLRHRLPKVPKFCDAALLKPNDTDDSHTEVTRLLPHVGMDSHEVALGYDTLHLQDLVWVLARVLLHPCQKGLRKYVERGAAKLTPPVGDLFVRAADPPETCPVGPLRAWKSYRSTLLSCSGDGRLDLAQMIIYSFSSFKHLLHAVKDHFPVLLGMARCFRRGIVVLGDGQPGFAAFGRQFIANSVVAFGDIGQ